MSSSVCTCVCVLVCVCAGLTRELLHCSSSSMGDVHPPCEQQMQLGKLAVTVHHLTREIRSIRTMLQVAWRVSEVIWRVFHRWIPELVATTGMVALLNIFIFLLPVQSSIVIRLCTCCSFFSSLEKRLLVTTNKTTDSLNCQRLRGCLATFPIQPKVFTTFLKNLVNTDVKKTGSPAPLFNHWSENPPTCPSSDCSLKLTSNNWDNDQVGVQRRTARLEARPIRFILLSLQPMERANPCRGVAAY